MTYVIVEVRNLGIRDLMARVRLGNLRQHLLLTRIQDFFSCPDSEADCEGSGWGVQDEQKKRWSRMVQGLIRETLFA